MPYFFSINTFPYLNHLVKLNPQYKKAVFITMNRKRSYSLEISAQTKNLCAKCKKSLKNFRGLFNSQSLYVYRRTQKLSLSKDDRLKNAALWLVRSRDKDFTSEDRKMFTAWLEEDPANREAFDEMNNVWQYTGEAENLFVSENEYECRANKSHKKSVLKSVKQFFKFNKIMTACSSAAVVLVCFALLFKIFSAQPVQKFYPFTTAIGEQKTVTLSDGSVLKMNVSSSVFVSVNNQCRQVKMMKGEVFFEVAPDPERPFEVLTPNGKVSVLGTAFNIKNRNGVVSIDVDHGRVRVFDSPKGPGGMRKGVLTLISGQGTDVDSSGRLTSLRTSEIKQVLAWQHHQAVFRNTSISTVVKELELYHNVKIKLSLKKPENKKITGTFNMYDLEQTLRIIAAAASLEIEKDGDRTITLFEKFVTENRP